MAMTKRAWIKPPIPYPKNPITHNTNSTMAKVNKKFPISEVVKSEYYFLICLLKCTSLYHLPKLISTNSDYFRLHSKKKFLKRDLLVLN